MPPSGSSEAAAASNCSRSFTPTAYIPAMWPSTWVFCASPRRPARYVPSSPLASWELTLRSYSERMALMISCFRFLLFAIVSLSS